jgi:PAS domain S-box-containing protein
LNEIQSPNACEIRDGQRVPWTVIAVIVPRDPDDEERRLSDLRSLGLLDRAPDARFDRLVRLASRVLGVPISAMSLVDDHRQWFASEIGLGVSETSRDVSFCGHAILGDDVMVVNDALSDVRFADNPLVLGPPGIRFYAGAPIHAPSGSAIGTLCVIDTEPRHLDEADLDALRDLAALVDDELRVSDAVARFRTADASAVRMRVMLDALTEGLVFQAADGSIADWNAAAEVVLGLSAEELSGRRSIDPRWRAVHEDGSPWDGATHPAMVAIATGEVQPPAVMGVHRPNGDLVWLSVNAQPVSDADGSPAGALAAFSDITVQIDLKRRTARMTETIRAAVENGAVGMAMLDRFGCTRFMNRALAEIIGVDPSDAVGMVLRDFLQPDDPVHAVIEEMRVGSIDRLSEDVCLRTEQGDEPRWIRLNVTVVQFDDDLGAIVQVTEITERKRLQAQLARSEEIARVCLDSLDQGVIFASPTLGIHRMNPAAGRITGWSAEELFDEWISPRRPILDEHLTPFTELDFPGVRAIVTGEAVKDEVIWMPRKDGDWVRVRFTAVPFGWTDEVVMVFTDITPYLAPGAPRPPLDAVWERVEGRLIDVTPRA